MKRSMRRVRRLQSARLPRTTGPGAAGSGAADGRPVPVNPYSLLVAINDASSLARTSWLAALAVIAWLCVAIAGVRHRDLLTGTAVALPLLEVEIDIERLFVFAPLVLLFLMLGVLVQHVVLARRAHEFDVAVAREEPLQDRSHPLRLELDGYFLTQVVAGPERRGAVARVQSAMSWVSFVALPVGLLLAIQCVFLPYRDQAVTMGHRAALLGYVVMLCVLGVVMMRPAEPYRKALRWIADHRPLSFLATVVVLAGAVVFSCTLATIKGGFLDRQLGPAVEAFLRNPWFRAASLRPARTLSLRGQDLVRDGNEEGGEASIDLSGRDLQFGDFEGADLHRARFSGARLDNARLTGADLRRAVFGCRTDFERNVASLQHPCVSMRGVDLQGAKLKGALIDHADLTGATLTLERLAEAEVRDSFFRNATFYSETVGRAGAARPDVRLDMRGWLLEGANLASTDLSGARMAGARLAGARIDRARLVGADLTDADLSGADLTEADLSGADLTGARLDGAVIARARLEGARITDAQRRAATLVARE